jgi:hypothetical protein
MRDPHRTTHDVWGEPFIEVITPGLHQHAASFQSPAQVSPRVPRDPRCREARKVGERNLDRSLEFRRQVREARPENDQYPRSLGQAASERGGG